MPSAPFACWPVYCLLALAATGSLWQLQTLPLCSARRVPDRLYETCGFDVSASLSVCSSISLEISCSRVPLGPPVSLTVVKQFGSTGALRIFRLCTARRRSFILVRALEVLFSYTSCLNDSPLLSDNHRVPTWQTHLGLRNYALMMFVVLMTTCFVSAAF